MTLRKNFNNMKFLTIIKNSKIFKIINSSYLLKLLFLIFLGIIFCFLPAYLADNFTFFDYDFVRQLPLIYLIPYAFYAFYLLMDEGKSVSCLAVVIVFVLLIISTTLINPKIINFIDHPEISISYLGRDLTIETVKDTDIRYIIDTKYLYDMSSLTNGSDLSKYETISTNYQGPSCSGGPGNRYDQCDDTEYNETSYSTPYGKVLYGEDLNSGVHGIVIYPNNLNIFKVVNKQVAEVLEKNNKINKIHIKTNNSNQYTRINIIFKDNKILTISLN